MIRAVVIFASICVLGSAALAADALSIDGQVAHPLRLSIADLKTRPATSIDVSFMTGHGQEHGHYTGVLLWTLVEQVALTDTTGKHPDLHHTLSITGSDGYVIVLSFGEIDPDFGGQSVILAYARDEKPLTPGEGIRLVVPGDKLGARDVRDVVRIEVK